MGVLDQFDLDNVPELEILPEGEEQVMIVSAEDYVGQTSGKVSIKVILSFPEHANASDIFHYIAIPAPEDDERTKNNKLRRANKFLAAFGLTKQDDYADWCGKTAWALIGQEPDNNGEMRNTIKNFVTSA